MKREIFLVLAVITLAGCTAPPARTKDCGTDFNCFLAEMNRNCSPAKVLYTEMGVTALFEVKEKVSATTLLRTGLLCKTNVKIANVSRTEEMDDQTWKTISSALPLLRSVNMDCEISPRTAKTLYEKHNMLLARDTLKSCSGSLLDLINMYMGDSITNETIADKENQTVSPGFNQTVPTGLQCDMAHSSGYMRVITDTQGEIKGEVTLHGHEDSIKVLELSDWVFSPRDAASGLPTGKRQHKPFTITKELDKSSPLLMQALVNNENMDVQIDVYGTAKDGREILCYSIDLLHANIASITHDMDAINQTAKFIEEINFTYQKIDWTHEEAGISSSDDWEAPIV